MSVRFEVGDVADVRYSVIVEGVSTDPTTLAFTVQKPDGTDLHYGWPDAGTDGLLTRAAVGVFSVAQPLDQSGPWYVQVQGLGAAQDATSTMFRVSLPKGRP